MASNLDLQEQEQLDELKAFWKQYGNLITWLITLVLAGFAAYNGWNLWQSHQAKGAAGMFGELAAAAQTGDADRTGKVFADMKDRFAGAELTRHAAMLTARVQSDKGQTDAAMASLNWVIEHSGADGLGPVARLRLSGLLIEKKSFDDALKQLDAITGDEYRGLVQDRRGDVLMAQGKKDEAVAAWQAAWKALPEEQQYRRIVEAKLDSQGRSPVPAEPAASEAAR
ncbi:MAG: tetratricopeptide repeat protein [Burkholderiales bacterium]|nr:tetratricopeptide repeat protein [Burkholderiales bacterium]